MDRTEPINPDDTDWVEAAPRSRAIAAAALPAHAFRMRRPVRFGDCDPAGIVYTPRFVDMANQALEAFFPEALGLDYYGLIRDEKLGLGYGRIGFDFLRPGLMGDVLDLTVLVGRVGGASVAFRIHAHRDEDELFRATMVVVTTSLVSHRAIPLPPYLRAALTAYQERCR